MANNVVVITDSIANLPEQLVGQYGISIVPIMLLVQGKLYRDGVDISPSEAYKLFLQDPESFNTSPTLIPDRAMSSSMRRSLGFSVLKTISSTTSFSKISQGMGFGSLKSFFKIGALHGFCKLESIELLMKLKKAESRE